MNVVDRKLICIKKKDKIISKRENKKLPAFIEHLVSNITMQPE